MSAVPAFDVCGPLPTGVTVLEASAGTGKTFTIAALTARYVADGVPLEHMLLVTFTRMATGELRERVRARLVSAEQGLARSLAGVAPPGEDEVLCLLAAGAPSEVARRRRRLAGALADFDAATIDTTHGFCQHVLAGLGVAGDVERDATFTEDLADLIDEVVDDLYVRRFHAGGTPPFRRAQARRIARAAVDHASAPLEPAAASAGSDAAERHRFAVAVRREVELRKRRARVITYDDLLTRLEATLADESERGATACRRLWERYRVVLVDEFQDTDPTQWGIVRRAFGDGGATLVLIGDPKQAVYSFRGADVYAYLDASRTARRRATLAVNWRSDQGLVEAYDALFAQARLGHPGIAYTPVVAADAHRAPGLVGLPSPAPLRVRVVHRDDGLVRLRADGHVVLDAARRHVAADLAADLVRLLSSGAEVVRRGLADAGAGRERLRPGHAAVLVPTRKHARFVRDALDAVRIPGVVNGAGSVLQEAVAGEWLTLLEALERPASATRARAASLTPFLGWTAERLAAAGEDALADLHGRLHAWAAVLRNRGVASLVEAVTHAEGLPARLLATEDGERRLTDLRHVGQLLHAEAVAEGLGVTALAAWLRQRIREAGEDTTSEERSRRLESDAEAVQILTVHRSKGLEFPVVYCPYLWEPGWIPDPGQGPAVFHDPAGGDRRTVHVGMGTGPGFAAAWRQYVDEQRGEDLRLAYVALTRARHQAVVWWAGGKDSARSPLGRLLFARGDAGDAGEVGAGSDRAPADASALATLGAVAARAPGRVAVERATGGDGVVLAGERGAAGDLAVRRFGRGLDRRWRRTSYTGITSGGHEARVASEPEYPVLADEAHLPVLPRPVLPRPPEEGAAEAEHRLRATPSPLAAMPGGTEVGSLVHAVLEHVDFTAPDLDGELAAAVDEQRRRRNVDVGDVAAVVAGLRAAVETPLGPLVGDVRLRDVARADRLEEITFELPLVGGDRPTAVLTLDALADVLRSHLPPADPMAAYPDRLADPALRPELRGYLAGAVDLVLRVRAGDGTPRFAVVDHKTNRLGGDDGALSAWHYRPAALAAAMQAAHYPLQALLYTVALHRYLRWRLPGYDPERNLAGVLYLFLRGMTGASAPRVDGQPCGVFAWRPPPGLVPALSDLFDRGAPSP